MAQSVAIRITGIYDKKLSCHALLDIRHNQLEFYDYYLAHYLPIIL